MDVFFAAAGPKVFSSAERMQFGGIVPTRRPAPYRSVERRDWRKINTAAWRATNQEPRRWRLFEQI